MSQQVCSHSALVWQQERCSRSACPKGANPAHQYPTLMASQHYPRGNEAAECKHLRPAPSPADEVKCWGGALCLGGARPVLPMSPKAVLPRSPPLLWLPVLKQVPGSPQPECPASSAFCTEPQYLICNLNHRAIFPPELLEDPRPHHASV